MTRATYIETTDILIASTGRRLTEDEVVKLASLFRKIARR